VPKIFSSSDRALAARIEAAEAATALALARALQQVNPKTVAAAEPALGGYALFGGVGSPMTHALGIGMTGAADEAAFDRMEEFFRSRGSASLIDLCPMADPTVIRMVHERGYHVIEFNNILVREVVAEPVPEIGTREAFPVSGGGLHIEKVQRQDTETWANVVARGFLEQDQVPAEFMEMMSGGPGMSDCFLARLNGQPAGGGAVGIRGGVASFYGDSTLVAARGHGIQRALIEQRLAHAARAGCDVATVAVVPGSGSHRNYERCGFQLVYMRVNVMREWK
jgi:GNAT superfamily N-acetyltransferase